MKFNELVNKIESGEITVNLQRHKLFTPINDYWGEYEPYNLLKILKNTTKKVNFWDFKNKSSMYVCTLEHCDIIRIPEEINVGECIYLEPILCHSPFEVCGACGKTMVPYLYSDTEIRFVEAYKTTFTNDELKHVPEDDFDKEADCPMADIVEQDYLETTIDVKDSLLFCNFFAWDELDPRDDYYDINYLQGRYEYMMSLAKRGVCYGQTDDCSGHIFINNDKTKVIVVKSCENANEETYTFRGEEFNKIGRICFDVWSYRCVDNAIVKELKKNHDKNDPVVPNYRDYCYADVVPGKYKFMHYERYLGECNDDPNIWTVIEKI